MNDKSLTEKLKEKFKNLTIQNNIEMQISNNASIVSTAKNLIDMWLSIENIAKATGLSIEKIEKLK